MMTVKVDHLNSLWPGMSLHGPWPFGCKDKVGLQCPLKKPCRLVSSYVGRDAPYRYVVGLHRRMTAYSAPHNATWKQNAAAPTHVAWQQGQVRSPWKAVSALPLLQADAADTCTTHSRSVSTNKTAFNRIVHIVSYLTYRWFTQGQGFQAARIQQPPHGCNQFPTNQ